MTKYTIYALVDPNTHEVRYVGQAKSLESRYRNHLWWAENTPPYTSNRALIAWIRSLHPTLPVVVLLQEGEQAIVTRKDGKTQRASSICESKCIKRFRRSSLLNHPSYQDAQAYKDLTNPGEEGA